VNFTLADSGGDVHTEAQISAKAASRGERMIQSFLEAMIQDFTQTFVATA
jgi:carbon monoxide dehydrogenase subunit G